MDYAIIVLWLDQNDFYINADDIFNSIKEEKEQALDTLKELLTEMVGEDDDNHHDA